MSVIHTCALCGVNAFEYLKALQLHAEDVKARAAQWLERYRSFWTDSLSDLERRLRG